MAKVLASAIRHPVIATITRDDQYAAPAPGFGEHVEAAKTAHRQQVLQQRRTRDAEAREADRLYQEGRMLALAEEQAAAP